MRIEVITIFPELFPAFLSTSLVGRGIEAGRLEVGVHDLRSHTTDPHRSVDDEAYGGGGGMVMAAPPWLAAVRAIDPDHAARRILLSPQGRRLDEAVVRELAGKERLLLLCGRYEGIDERVSELVIDDEVSIGDYVLSGGEVAALVVIEALSRQIPGVVGLPESVEKDSFRSGLLDHPHYTRPREVEGRMVPEVLLSGDHAEIERWRRRAALRATLRKRPDLLAKLDDAEIGETEQRILSELRSELRVERASEPTDES
jgi:tRNA (guanine37-N1)-methyltransferase